MEYNKYKGLGLTGLGNLGNTCFLNSTLQCISHTYEFNEYLESKKWMNTVNEETDSLLLIEWDNLRKMMWEENCVVQPVSFRKSLITLDNKYSGYEQHDLSETLGIIIDSLHIGISYEANISYEGVAKNKLDKLMINSIKKWSNIYKNESSSILDLFYGQYILKINNKTSGVKKISYNFDPFNILTLPINNCKNKSILNKRRFGSY